MHRRIQMSADITVGSQPTRDEIEKLAEEGFGSVVNLRTEGEDDQPLSPDEEGRVVEGAGMEYFHLPVSTDDMREDSADLFRERLDKLPAPVFVHCKSGMRSGAFAMMHRAVEHGTSGDEAIRQALEMGFECDDPQIKDFVKSYIDRRRQAA